jgi:hypothetical protein
MSVEEWRQERAKKSPQGWADAANALLKDTQSYFGSWHSKDDEGYNSIKERSNALLAQADSWRKQYAGNDEVISYIDEVVSALSKARQSSKEYFDFYGQWDSEDAYKGYLTQQKEYDAKVNLDINAADKEIAGLESLLAEYDRLILRQSTADPEAEANVRLREIREKYGSKEDIEALLSQKKVYRNQAKHIQEGITLSGVTGNADFTAHTGYVSTYDDSVWSRLTSDYGLGYEDLTYEYINNQNGIRDEINHKHRVYDKGDDESSFEAKGYDYLTEDEISIYNYYYSKEGKEAAQKYLDSIQETLNHRKATSMYSEMEGKTFQELIFGVEAGLDQFKSGMHGAVQAITGEDDYIPQSAFQMASAMVREDLGDVGAKLPDWLGGASIGQAGYDLVTTSANMAPSILSSAAMNIMAPGSGAFVGNAMMFASAGGNAYQEALNSGFDKEQARSYAALVGASEAGLQYLLGGISSLGGKASGAALTKMLDGIDNAFARTAIKLGGNMLSEGMEEGLQEILTPWFKELALDVNEDINWSEVAYSGLLGALTAGFMEGGSTISGEVNTYNTGRQLQKADISAQRLAEIGNTFAADTVAYQLAGRVNENTGAYTMGRLFNEIGATLTEQNVNEITEALVAKGMPRNVARANAKAMARVVEGGNLTDTQVKIIEANDVLAEAVRTTIIDPNATWFQRTNGYNEALMALAQEKTSGTKQSAPGRENETASGAVDAKKESSSEGGSEASEVDASPAKVSSITSIADGNVKIQLEDGSEVDAVDADLDPEDGVIIETIAKIGGISVNDANYIMGMIKADPGVKSQWSALGASEAYKYGFYGMSEDHMTTHGVFSNSLNKTQRKVIYETGRNARQTQVEAQQATVRKNRTVAKNATTGKVHFDGDRSKLTERQNVSLTAMEKIADALGVQIYVFESKVGADGKRIGANGWYDPRNNSIHIDLHAGANGEGMMLFTLAHELTHHIRKWSPAKFKVLSDFLMDEYGKKGVDVDALVHKQIDKAWRTRKEKLSYDAAFEEVVADSMEMMLSDGNVMNRVEKLMAVDKDLWHEIKRFINDLANKIRNIYKGLKPDSVEGRYVADMGKAVYRLQELFAEALVDASENYQMAEKNTTDDGGDVMYMSRDIEDVTEDTVRHDLSEVFNGNNVSANSYIPLSKTTPFALRYITGYTKDLPIIVDKKKAYFDMRESGKFKEDSSHHYHGMGIDGFINAMDILTDPEYAIREQMNNGSEHFAFISTNENGEEVCVVFQMGVTKPANQMNGYPGGYYNLDITEFVATDEWLEERGVEPGTSYKDYLLSFPGNSIAYDRSIHREQMEKARAIDSESAGLAASYNNSRAFNDKVAQGEPEVKNKSAEAMDIEVDSDTESVAPAVLFSERTWTESDYVQEREKAAAEISKAIGVSVKKAKAYIDSVNSIAKMIAEDRVRLDYFSSPGRSSFVSNVEYGGSFDFSTLCKKRRLLTGTFTAIQKALPNTALTADEILDIRNRMKEKGLEVSCGLCYVEGSRANMGQFAKEFLKLYKQYYPDAWQPNMADVNTPDGIEWVRINHPECYEQYEYFWNHYGTLKPGDKNLFASQQKPKLYQLHTEYKGEILQKFKDDENVEEKNLNGGIRLQSFSDFEIVHLIDTMQIIMDMSRVGLAGQAYTKVPDFAWALGDTGLKINLSLIAKGVDENGRLIFDDVEGMPIADAMKLRERYSKNVGTILVAFNDAQLLAAMADERVDFIIPFHRSQWKKSQYEAMGLPAKTKDYTYMQNEKFIKPQFHEYRGRMVKDKATNYMPNEYWDFSKSGKENAVAYLEMCARNNKRPKFYKLLQNNGDGSYSLKTDGSTDGYWKLLIDFKMYDNDGNGSPQMPVKPDFNMDEATRMLNAYSGGHSNFPVAQGIVDSFVKEYKGSHKDYSSKYIDMDADVDVQYSSKEETTEGYSNDERRIQAGTSEPARSDRKHSRDTVNGRGNRHDGREGTRVKEWGKLSKRDREKFRKTLESVIHDSPNYSEIRIYLASVIGKPVLDMTLADRTAAVEKVAENIYADITNRENSRALLEGRWKLFGNVTPLIEAIYHENVMFSDRDTDSISNRSLLANALEGVAQNDIERNKIQEYKGKISLIESEERKLAELKEQIKELSFAKGQRDTKKILELRDEATKTANRIGIMDKQLLRLEASKPLQSVLEREKAKAYKRAEKKGKEALEAYRKDAEAKQKQTIERYQESRKKAVENREKTAMRHKIQNVVGELNNLLLHGDKKRHVPENLKKAVADALALVNMDTVGAEERAAKYAALIAKETDPDKIDAYTVTMENILRQGEKMGQRLKELRDAYEEIQESDDPDIANAYDPVIAGSLKELSASIGNTSLRDMSIEQLSDVYDMYRMVLTRVRDANKALQENIKENITELATHVIGEVRMTGGDHKYRAAILDPAKKFLWNNLKPVYAMEMIGSSTLTKVFDNVRAGEDTWAKDVAEAREYYLEQSRKYGYDKWDFDKKYRFTSASELEFELTLEQILSLYAYSKRKQADDHLRLGGFVFDSNIETYTEEGSKLLKYKVNTADAHQITPEILAEIIGTLSSEQMGFVDEMQDYLSTVMGAKGNEVTMKMYGVKLFREKHYFPLKSAKQFMFEQNEVSGEVKIKNSGFTNKVVAKANNPVILSNFMDVWAGHVNDMSMYHSFVLPLEDFNRVFNYNSPKKDNEPSVSVKGTIQNAYSPAAVNYVKNMITDLNGGARTDSTTGVINKLMGLFKKGAVFASASVVVQQPSAIARAAALVDTKYFIGPKVDHKRHKELWDEVKQYAPVAIIKEMGYFDTNMGKSTQDFILGKEYSGIKEKMKAMVTDGDYRDEVLSKAPALADEIAWCGIWDAVKREMHDQHPGLDVKSEPFLMLAGARFTEVITKTQVYDSVLSRSANMRSKDTGMKMATAFMAEPTTSINMIADALLQGKRGGKEGRRYCRKTVGAVIASVILNSFLVSWVQAARDDDEDESYMEKYVGSFTAEMLDGMNPLTYIPFIKDIVSIVQGYDVERSDMSVISDVVNAIRKLASNKVSGWKKVEDFAGSVCQIFGLPVKNIMRDVRGAWQAFDTIVNGEKTTARGIGYAVKGAITGKDVSNPVQLYESVLAGDETHAARVAARYADEDSANAAVRQSIKNDYLDNKISAETAMDRMISYTGMTNDEAYWLMDAWRYRKSMGTDDGYSKFSAFFTAVQTGKNLKNVIKDYVDHGVEAKTLRSQITEEFKPLYVKMSAVERAAIKGYLLNAFEQCGMVRLDAEEKLADWDFEAKHGFDYENRGEAYRNREITREQLMDSMQTYGGMTKEEAERYIGEQDFHVATGYAYDDKAKAYKEGYLDADILHMALMNIDGLSEEEADVNMRAYNWMKQNPSYELDVNEALAYTKTIELLGYSIEESGIDPNTFVQYRNMRSTCKGTDADGDGQADSGTVKSEVMEVIDSLPISIEQKDALYFLNGWAKSRLREAPWH